MTQRANYETLGAEGMKALGGVHMYIARSGLPKALVNLVFLRASQINGCAYCIDMHSRDLLKSGMAIDKVLLVSAWHDAGSYFDDRERAALAWTETVTLVSQTHIPDDAYAAAAAVFSEKELVDLTFAIALMNTYNRIAIGFRRLPDSPSRAAA